MMTPPPRWDDLAWLRGQWDGPLLIKGVTHPDDARHAVDIGADAISVSNHGGNNLDTTPASTVAEAVDGRRAG
jgi:isopentenyl diphosphate isomerase/L-lactate dehydrogenase-like FMN-dependent dehydrogenase